MSVIIFILFLVCCILAYIIMCKRMNYTGGYAHDSHGSLDSHGSHDSHDSHSIDSAMDNAAHELGIGDIPLAANTENTVHGRGAHKVIKYKGGGQFGSVYKLHLKDGTKGNIYIDASNAPNAPNAMTVTQNNNANWTQYRTWGSLISHKNALAKYSQDVRDVLKNPNLDWRKVQAEIVPKLTEPVEYIGLINLEEDGKTLYISDIFKSHQQKNANDSSSVFASIPHALVEKTMNIPALFIFHTHPADVRACQMPSSHDISTAIYCGSANHYAANIVISRFGIILYGIHDNMKDIFYSDEDKDHAELVRLNYTLDVVMAHESIRSWKPHTLQDYVDFYDKYKLFLYIYPSSEFVASRKETEYDLHYPLDYCVIESHYKYLKRFLDDNKKLKAKFSK